MYSSALLIARTPAFGMALAYEWQLLAAAWQDVSRIAQERYYGGLDVPGVLGKDIIVHISAPDFGFLPAVLAAADVAGRRESFLA